MDELQQRYVEKSGRKYQRLFARLFEGKGSRPDAVKAKCVDCVGQEDIVLRVGECDITTCALWWFRPYQRKG
jgi:hypothetical protein